MNVMLILATTQLVLAFQDARDVLFIATPSLDDARLVRSIGVATRAGANARVLLAPKAEYLIDDRRLLVGSDPYGGAQHELKSLQAMRVSIFVDPRFSEARAQSVRTGTRSGMSFAVMGKGVRSPKVAFVCTGSMAGGAAEAESNVCIRTDDSAVHDALLSLHQADFDDTQSLELRKQKTADARRRLVVSPGPAPVLEKLVREGSTVEIYTARFQAASDLGRLVIARGSKATLYVPPSAPLSSVDLVEAREGGVDVRHAARPFSGSMIMTDQQVFVGSQALTNRDFQTQRHVGVIFERSALTDQVRLGARK